MSNNVSLRSGDGRPQMLVVSPTRRERVDLPQSEVIRPSPTPLPKGVRVETRILKQEEPVPEEAPVSRDVVSIQPDVAFSQGKIDQLVALAKGQVRMSEITTESGVMGQLVETPDGPHYRMLLPAGVLPEPLVLQKDTDLQGHSRLKAFAGLALKEHPASLEGSRVTITLDEQGTVAVFDEDTLTFGMQSPSYQDYDHTSERKERADLHYSYATGRDWRTYRVGSTGERRNIEEYVRPDGTREIVADALHHHVYEEAGAEDRNTEVRIVREPDGDLEASFVTRARDQFFGYETSWDYGGKTVEPLKVREKPDGSFEITKSRGIKRAVYGVGNFVRNFGKRTFYGDHLQPFPSETMVVKPFSVCREKSAPPEDDLFRLREALFAHPGGVVSTTEELIVGGHRLDVEG